MSDRPKRLTEPAQIGCLNIIPGTWFRNWHMYTGCSIEVCDGERAIIDPASDPEELKKVAERGVGVMLHSHIHGDHILYSEIFEGTPLWVPAAEAGDYGDQDKLAREFGISEKMLIKWRTHIDPIRRTG